ncbi:hypothetical protein HHI36_017219 [Cryptolaemus montrouzieri]|uniref:Uncharacterized protein n=1 Tax=Cryptolaemus montrouzieri TaxID=559131 RepID=A0ABD2NMA3_9CUCU
MVFLQDLAVNYGLAAKLSKQWTSLKTKLSHHRNRCVFLLQCKNLDVVPRHTGDNTRKLINNLPMQENGAGTSIEQLNYKMKRELLRLEISLTVKHVRKLEERLNKKLKRAKNTLSVYGLSMNLKEDKIVPITKNSNVYVKFTLTNSKN